MDTFKVLENWLLLYNKYDKFMGVSKEGYFNALIGYIPNFKELAEFKESGELIDIVWLATLLPIFLLIFQVGSAFIWTAVLINLVLINAVMYTSLLRIKRIVVLQREYKMVPLLCMIEYQEVIKKRILIVSSLLMIACLVPSIDMDNLWTYIGVGAVLILFGNTYRKAQKGIDGITFIISSESISQLGEILFDRPKDIQILNKAILNSLARKQFNIKDQSTGEHGVIGFFKIPRESNKEFYSKIDGLTEDYKTSDVFSITHFKEMDLMMVPDIRADIIKALDVKMDECLMDPVRYNNNNKIMLENSAIGAKLDEGLLAFADITPISSEFIISMALANHTYSMNRMTKNINVDHLWAVANEQEKELIGKVFAALEKLKLNLK